MAFVQVIGTHDAVTPGTAEETVRADIIFTEAAAPVNMFPAEGLVADRAGDGMVTAEPFSAHRAPGTPRLIQDLPAFLACNRFCGGGPGAGRAEVLLPDKSGPRHTGFADHFSACTAGDHMVCANNTVAGRAVEETIRADVLGAQAAVQPDVIAAEGFMTDPAIQDMIGAQGGAAGRTSEIDGP